MAKTEANGARVVNLRHPIEHGSETITALTIQRFKGKFLKGFPTEGATVDDIYAVISRATGQPTSVIEELEGEDLLEVMTIFGNFLPRGRATGGNRSRS